RWRDCAIPNLYSPRTTTGTAIRSALPIRSTTELSPSATADKAVVSKIHATSPNRFSRFPLQLGGRCEASPCANASADPSVSARVSRQPVPRLPVCPSQLPSQILGKECLAQRPPTWLAERQDREFPG